MTVLEHGQEYKLKPKLDITINLPQFARLQRLRLDPQKEANTMITRIKQALEMLKRDDTAGFEREIAPLQKVSNSNCLRYLWKGNRGRLQGRKS